MLRRPLFVLKIKFRRLRPANGRTQRPEYYRSPPNLNRDKGELGRLLLAKLAHRSSGAWQKESKLSGLTKTLAVLVHAHVTLPAADDQVVQDFDAQ